MGVPIAGFEKKISSLLGKMEGRKGHRVKV